MLRYVFLLLAIATLIWSGISPKDRLTWFLEVAPVLIGMPIALWLDRKGKLTGLLFILLCIHAVILCIGGRYTYAEVPIGFYVQELFGFARNHYDRLGHLAQGFVPAIIFREWLIRAKVVNSKKALPVIVCALCLSFSAIYEFIEWFTALVSDEGAEAFLGTQGDVWDTQWDMFLALVGSILAQVFLSRVHDRQLQRLGVVKPS